jgi:hypothetical protein
MLPISLWLVSSGCTGKEEPVTNAAPSISIINPADGDVWTENSEVQLLAQVADEDHFAMDLQVHWMIDGETICDWTAPDGGGNATCAVTAAVNMSQVRAEVKDPEGASSLKEVSVSVESTNPPEVSIITPVDGSSFYADQAIDLSASIADLDDSLNDLNIVWTATGVGELDILPPDSDGIVTDQITLPEGNVTLTLEATDPSGKVDSASVDLTITAPNSAPTCEITQPNTGEFSIGGSSVTFAGTMSDVDIDANLLAVTWTSDKDGELSSGMADSTGTYTFETSEMTLNTHQITLTVTDEMGLQCTDVI